MIYRVPLDLLGRTFDHFRRCGQGRRECQALWISPWCSPDHISDIVHPRHRAHAQGFDLDSDWLNSFWIELANSDSGIRVQVHTHPRAAFHSPTDDAFPIIHTPGFLSLVVPNFGLGAVGFQDAYLAELGSDGRWREIACSERLKII